MLPCLCGIGGALPSCEPHKGFRACQDWLSYLRRVLNSGRFAGADARHGSGMEGVPGATALRGRISKSWKIRHNLVALVTGPLPRQGLTTGYVPFSAPWTAIVTGCMSSPPPCADLILRYNTSRCLWRPIECPCKDHNVE